MRGKEVYDGLINHWGQLCNDEDWISGLKKQYNLRDDEWSSDCFFLITLSWGPWREGRQMDVWNKMKNTFPEVKDDIRNADKSFDGFPLKWQNDRTISISKYLKGNSKKFEDIMTILRLRSGIEARDYLAEICGAGQKKKTISCFVRDFLLKDTFPIDSRVSKMLSSLGLPNDEDLMIKLCELDGSSSRLLNRMLYTHWEYCPSKPSKKCEECRINNSCWDYLLSKKE